jgi:hypothetical protein
MTTMAVGRRRPFRLVGWLTVLGLLALALLGPTAGSATGNDTPGNNGTVKIHEGATETEPGPQNEPHVCTFHLHFFFADPVQAGTWEIQEWSPGDKGTVVLDGTYDTEGDGEDRQPAEGTYSLPDGHYKLFWDGDLDTDKHDKHKVFWVDCPAPTGDVGPTELPSSAPPSQPMSPSVPPSEAPPSVPASVPASPSGGVSPTESVPVGGPSGSAPVVTPSGGVGGVTGAPTLPPTDSGGPSAEHSGFGLRLALVSLAAVLAAVLIVTPHAQPIRRR